MTYREKLSALIELGLSAWRVGNWGRLKYFFVEIGRGKELSVRGRAWIDYQYRKVIEQGVLDNHMARK